MSAAYPAALNRLTSAESFDPAAISNVTGRHLRQIIGSDLKEATPVDDEDEINYQAGFLVDRVMNKEDTVVIVTGEPGVGKSMFTMMLGSIVKRRLGLETGTSRTLDLELDIVSRLTTFSRRVYQSSRKNPLVVIGDEGVLVGAQSGSGLTGPGRILDRVLSVSRIKACTIFILHPSIWGVAAFVRNRRAKVWYHVERRGLTTAFILKDALDFTPPHLLPFKKMRHPWNRIHWESIENKPMWAAYEPAKLETVNQTLVDAEIQAAEFEKKEGMRPPSAAFMDYWEPSSLPRAPGETDEELERRRDRVRKQRDRRSQRVGQERDELESSPNARAYARA
ncbi:MAG TPA: hypothetical protein VGG32_01095 [Thermoplasmata archaeon]|jgi:hypothetical protein